MIVRQDAAARADRRTGILLLVVAGLIGAGTAVVDQLSPASGIQGETGTLLVLGSSLLMVAGAAVAGLVRNRTVVTIFLALLLLDIVGTTTAAYFLESAIILLAMPVALIGWIVRVAGAGRHGARGAVALAAALFVVGVAATLVVRHRPTSVAGGVRPAAPAEDWSDFNGNPMGQKYSSASQITPENVNSLAVAWSLHTGDVSHGYSPGGAPKTSWQSTPLFVNGTVYVSTPWYRILAVQPDTGRIKWAYDARPKVEPKYHGKNRGISYWAAAAPVAGQPCQRRLYIGTGAGLLHAIDADTGRRCRDFGRNGILDVNQWNTINPRFPFQLNQSVAVYKDTLVVGWGGVDWTFEKSPPGSVFGIDARTGAKKWQFETIPENMRERIGTANVWASMSVDDANGLVYLPVSSPESNYYGGDRLQDIPYATSVTALHADTGAVAWVRQLVHHDIWDYDTDSAPTLVDIEKNGRKIPALVQSTKQGFLYVLNRLTGEPMYPMIERPVPASDVPGEHASPTQPFVPIPAPTIPQTFTGVFNIADWADFGRCSRDYRAFRKGPMFTPPSLQGTITAPGTVGGVEWSGGAVDPVSQTYVVNSSYAAQIYKLVPRGVADDWKRKVDAARAAGRPRPPGINISQEEDSPYGVQIYTWFNRWGMPCWAPPFGSLSAYDLKTGRLVWRRPFGQVQQWGFYMPESWGSVTFGAPAITRTGLIFIGGSMDSRVRALDLRTGKVLWKHLVEAPPVSTPAVYVYKGKQYVLFTAGGNGLLSPRVSDQLVAFALPGA